jgi:hypothetical protein
MFNLCKNITQENRLICVLADPSGRAAPSKALVCYRSLACWNFEFVSRRGHGSLFVVSDVCCQIEMFNLGLITRPEES